ncbi:hypothetical protein Zmor_012544 [Zophobas morio]|uniref:Uncharacterized protein n=1 Tax=Zophobas morio TaxID=2755281 RepID=A0AA38IDS7_9CUCU|nr:hypothetical protein Zmor_012544 [Zophobas morio]
MAGRNSDAELRDCYRDDVISLNEASAIIEREINSASRKACVRAAGVAGRTQQENPLRFLSTERRLLLADTPSGRNKIQQLHNTDKTSCDKFMQNNVTFTKRSPLVQEHREVLCELRRNQEWTSGSDPRSKSAPLN